MEQDIIDPLKESIVNEIFATLTRYAPDEVIEDEIDVQSVRRATSDLLDKKWLPYEIVRYLRWMEHVDPTIDEDTALRWMKVARERAEARMKVQP
jgi:hypothetical protein